MLLWYVGLSVFSVFSVLTSNASIHVIKQFQHSGRVWHLFGTSFNGAETLWVISSIYVDLKFQVHFNERIPESIVFPCAC